MSEPIWRTAAARAAAALATAPLLALAHPPFDWAALALFALVPWLVAARRSRPVEALVTGAIVGTTYGILATAWLAEAFASLGSTGITAMAGHVWTAAWSKLALFAFVGWLVSAVRAWSAWSQTIVVAVAFGAGEWLHLVWHFGLPFVLLGHSQLPVLGVAQLAVVAGAPLLTGFVAAINMALALSIAGVTGARVGLAALIASWASLAVFGVPWAERLRPEPPDRAAVALLLIQPDFSHRARWVSKLQAEHLESVTRFTQSALDGLGTPVEAVVWPENLLTAPVDRLPELRDRIQRSVDSWGVPLIGGFVRSAPGNTRNHYRSSVLWWQPEAPQTHAIDKARAIPLLEASAAFPGSEMLESLYGRATRWPKVVEAERTGPLEGPVPLTVALCYEVLFPGTVAARNTPESLAILNLADDSWVAGDAASEQLLAAATFRAIETRKPLVRLAHGGVSRGVDAFGRTVTELPEGGWAYEVVSLEPNAPPGLGERTLFLGLPLATGSGVWWLAASLGRRRRRESR